MEQSIKLIKIQKPNKTQLYKDILSSSKKVQEIIKKTKINKSKFYKQKDAKNIVYEKTHQSINQPFNQYVPKDPKLENIVYEKPLPIPPPPYLPVNIPINQFVPKDPIKELENIVYEKSLYKPISISKKTWINNNYFKHEEKLNIDKKTCKNIVFGKYKSNKIKDYNQSNVLNYYNNSKKITMKIFTHKEIDKFINVLYYYSDYEQHVKIHKYIKKLNKYQTLQILYEINLIKSKSKAPLSMLKNILYNYFCCNINIIR
jgi:hypothetical protein